MVSRIHAGISRNPAIISCSKVVDSPGELVRPRPDIPSRHRSPEALETCVSTSGFRRRRSGVPSRMRELAHSQSQRQRWQLSGPSYSTGCDCFAQPASGGTWKPSGLRRRPSGHPSRARVTDPPPASVLGPSLPLHPSSSMGGKFPLCSGRGRPAASARVSSYSLTCSSGDRHRRSEADLQRLRGVGYHAVPYSTWIAPRTPAC